MNFLMSKKKCNNHLFSRGFTLVELLVVISIIGILGSILLVGIQGASSSSNILEDQNKLRQISQWMNLYSNENNGTVLPSQFNHEDEKNKGKVRTNSLLNRRYAGTWCDILWSEFQLFEKFGLSERDASNELLWYCDAPDSTIFEKFKYSDNYDATNYDNGAEENSPKITLIDFNHPFRAVTENKRSGNLEISDPTPFGTAANEKGMPGYFAANDYFDSRSSNDNPNNNGSDTLDRYLSQDQIFRPQKSVYLIDSWAGETIDYRINDGEVFETNFLGGQVDPNSTCQVDFRHGATAENETALGQSLILLLDGSTAQIPFFSNLNDLEGNREDLEGPRIGLGWKIQRLRQRR